MRDQTVPCARARALDEEEGGGGKEGWYDDDCSPGTVFRRQSGSISRTESFDGSWREKRDVDGENKVERRSLRTTRKARPQKGGGRARVGSLRAPQCEVAVPRMDQFREISRQIAKESEKTWVESGVVGEGSGREIWSSWRI